ncbi:Proline iminopeptidase [Talaromyces islandicus]|uniref:Proline iminopeptidase n=1 Tax=Talaromyces islandicus TaxID=28573 RepID=A0A0U1M0Z9_TALIS|nr:Proline iminopeptidase [Talaromyces islandicus]
MGELTTTVQMEDGARLHVKLLGGGPTSTEKPLLISLHGAPGLSTHLEPLSSFSHLSNTFRVLVYDARGSGESDHVGPFTHDRWIQDIENLRRWAGAETFVLAGASYGGFIALDYAVEHSDKLRGLILRDTWANGKVGSMAALANIVTSSRVKPDVPRQVRLWSGTLYDDKDFEAAVSEILPFYSPPEDVVQPEDLPESTEFRGSIKFHSATANFAFSVNMPQFDVRDKLKNITAPTLVVVGKYDYVTPVAYSEDIAKSIPNSRLEIFEYSGHSPPSDEPARFQEILLDFLKTEVL